MTDVRKYRDDLLTKWFKQLEVCMTSKADWQALFDTMNRFMVSSLVYPIEPTDDRVLQIALQSLVYANALRRLPMYHTGLFLTFKPPASNREVIRSGVSLSNVKVRSAQVEHEEWTRLIRGYATEVNDRYRSEIKTQLTNELTGRVAASDHKEITPVAKDSKASGTMWSNELIQLYSMNQFDLMDLTIQMDGIDQKVMSQKRARAESDLHLITLFFTEPCGWHSSCRPLVAAICAYLLSKVVTAQPLDHPKWIKWIYQCARHDPHHLFRWLRWWANRPPITQPTAVIRRNLSVMRPLIPSELKMCNDFASRVCREYLLGMWFEKRDPYINGLLRRVPLGLVGTIELNPSRRLLEFVRVYRVMNTKLDLSTFWSVETVPLFLSLMRAELVQNECF